MTLTPLVLVNADIYMDSVDLTGYSNQIQLAAKAVDLDKTTFNSNGWKERQGGVFDGDCSVDGFFQAGDLTMPDDMFWADLGNSQVPLTALPTGGSPGDLCYLTKVLNCEYTPGEKHGQLLAYKMASKTNWPITRGKILHPQGTARTATGNGTAVQQVAISSSQAYYAALHILGYTDGSITVAIQSSVDNTFASPTTVATFSAASGLGSQSARVLGPGTNTWYRVTWTITGGVTHSFLFAVSGGVGPK